MRIMASRRDWHINLGVDIRMIDHDRKEYVTLAAKKSYEINEGGQIPVALSLSLTESQMLMDALWDCGLRPSEGSGSAGALAATESHLADMKKIAFHALKIKRAETQDGRTD